MAQYGHAKNIDGKSICISEVSKNEKIEYFCIVCDKDLIPKTGEINEHHFAHKNKNIDCSKEKYFQLLGKMLFLEIYNDCKEKNMPFFIKIREKCINDNILCEYNYSTYNLLEYFDGIKMGNLLDTVISDLYVYNKNNKIIFIVTYYFKIVNQKNDYGNNRVIEIKLKTEEDLKAIKNRILSEENENIIFHNFKRQNTILQNCRKCNKCKNDISNIREEKQSNKYILLKFNGKIEIKHMETVEFQKVKKLYRHYKNVAINIEYYQQYKEFINECNERNYNVIEYNDFW